MIAASTTTLINLLGFFTGAALYTMLLMMVLKPSRRLPVNRLLLMTAILGLSWNIGAFAIYGLPNLSLSKAVLYLTAAAFTTLGFLPAVVVHLALRSGSTLDRHGGSIWLAWLSYGLSAIAGV